MLSCKIIELAAYLFSVYDIDDKFYRCFHYSLLLTKLWKCIVKLQRNNYSFILYKRSI